METTKSVWWVIPAWLLIVVYCFWWFEYRHWQSFQSLAVTFNGEDIHHLRSHVEASGNYTVMHFVDATCPCHDASLRHIQRLQEQVLDTQHVSITIHLASGIPATPSVAIWDEAGELAYFGPYSSGAICGEGTDFVTRVLVELRQKRNPRWINSIGVGCYCAGQSNEVSYVP